MQRLYKLNAQKNFWHVTCKQKAEILNRIGEKILSLPDKKHH